MPVRFQSVPDPTETVVDRIAELTPENPFCTNEYRRVRERLGADSCVLQLVDNDKPVTGCLAFITRGRLNSRIEVTSLPVLPEKDVFWQGLFDFCRTEGISILSVHTFASAETTIDEKRNLLSHKKRAEYQIDLTVPGLRAIINRRARRQLTKANEAGLELRKAVDTVARKKHVELANTSLDRKRLVGDNIDYRIELEGVNAFIECSAGEIFQAVAGGEVHGTLLVAKSRFGGYAQSSGTSDVGRDRGASHFLFFETARLLKSEGIRVFNLGGADEQSVGLQEFKLGLGAARVELESAEFYTGSIFKKFATKAIELIRH